MKKLLILLLILPLTGCVGRIELSTMAICLGLDGDADGVKGIRRGVKPAQTQFYTDRFLRTDRPDGSFVLQPASELVCSAEPGSDVDWILRGYITIGKVRSTVIGTDLS